MTAGLRVFWVDAEDDRERSSDGVSRYGAYVRRAVAGFRADVESYDDPTVPGAVRAWNLAVPPVMSPGFVRWHPRVLGARAGRCECSGDLRMVVDLASVLPERVWRACGWSWRSWERGAFGFREPEPRQSGPDKVLLPALTVEVTLPAGALPPVSATGWRCAAEAVRTICRGLNDVVGPVVAALDGVGS